MKKRPLKFLFWKDGKLNQCGGMHAYNDGDNFTGDDEHICEYTGLNDMNKKNDLFPNGVEIYEGNILENNKGEVGLVVWFKAGFHLECKRRTEGERLYIPLDEGMLKNKTIIGHYFLNPELLEQ